MPCVCARLPRFSKKSALNLHRSYILARAERPAGLRSPRTNSSEEDRTGDNGVGVLLCARRLPPRAPAAPRLLHLLQAAARCRAHGGESAGRGGGEAGLGGCRQEDARLSQIRRRRGGGVARGGGGGGRAAVGAGARRLRAAAGRPPLHRRQNGGRVRRRASGRSAEYPLHAQHRVRNGEELALSRASVRDLLQGRRDHHRMPKWQEVAHGSSRTLFRWLHCRDRHRRRVLDLEGEWTASQWPVTSSASLNVAET